jgi:hypothetical protein
MKLEKTSPLPTDKGASKIIFLHIPKTGGMSLRGLFVKNYRGQRHFNTDLIEIDTQKWQGCLDQVRQMSPEDLADIGVFKGHMLFGLHEIVPGPVEYITFLRDPVKRIVSHYRMHQRMDVFPPGHVIDPAEADWNVGVDPHFVRALDNAQTRLLAGMPPESPLGACTEEHLRLAKANMDRHFKFVGLMEQFDLSLMLLTHIAGWGWHFYVADNVAPAQNESISPSVLEALRELNRFDFALYRHAQERLQLLQARYGLRLQVEHALFRFGNKIHRQIYFAKHRSRDRVEVEQRKTAVSGLHES